MTITKHCCQIIFEARTRLGMATDVYMVDKVSHSFMGKQAMMTLQGMADHWFTQKIIRDLNNELIICICALCYFW